VYGVQGAIFFKGLKNLGSCGVQGSMESKRFEESKGAEVTGGLRKLEV
jgi:hypothetical protein